MSRPVHAIAEPVVHRPRWRDQGDDQLRLECGVCGVWGAPDTDAASVVAPFLKSGQLRGIMVTGASRVPAFPDIPTAAEQGISDFEITAWIGLMGPPDLPAEIVERTNAALRTAMADPDTAKKITDQGDEAGGTLSAAALGARMRREHTLWGEVVKRAGIKVE